MFEELASLKEKINNAHMSWIDLKVNGVLNEEMISEIEKIDWPSFAEFWLEDYCESYDNLAVHCITEYGRKTVTGILYGDIRNDLDDQGDGFMFDLYDLHELNGYDELAIGVLESKTLEEAKKETEKWIKAGLCEEISIDRIEDIFPRYFELEEDVVSNKVPDLAFPLVNDLHTLNQAVNRYGKSKQTDMAIEEMSELTKALLKYRRAKIRGDVSCENNALSAIHEETADVIIILTQILIMYGREDIVQAEIDRKVKRLAEQLVADK